MKRWALFWRILAILLVVSLALALRLRAAVGLWVGGDASTREELRLPIDYDEDDYLRAAQQQGEAMAAGEWEELTGLNYRPEHPPLAKLLYGAVLAFLPAAEEIPDRPTSASPADSLPQPHLDAARIAAAVLGTLEVALLALLSPLAGLFLGIHTFTIKYTSQVMLEALPALTSLAAVLCYGRSKGKWNGWLALSAVALGLTAASKYVYVVAGVAILGHWLWDSYPRENRAGRRRWVRWLAPVLGWGALSLAVFFLSDPYLWPDPLGRLRESLFYHAGYTQSEEVQRIQFPFWQPLTTLFQSVPWHPGVFVVSLDLLIAVFALLGLGRLRRKQPLLLTWLAMGLGFLFLWPTKWPQYVLILTAPLSVAAGEGFAGLFWEPLRNRLRRLRREGLHWPWGKRSPWARQESRRSVPWLLPGAVVLVLITLFPLVYQMAMSMTDFSATSIRDGIQQNGVWREVWAGLTGRVEPQEVQLDFRPGRRSTDVHYSGLGWFGQLFFPEMADLLVFELLWTVLSVALQVGLGLGVALILHRQGLRFKGWWRALFILPWAIPEFVGAMVWNRLLHPTYGLYTLAVETHTVVLPQVSWAENPNAALVGLLLAATWYGWPVMLLAATAGLNMISTDVYEAAAIDGAGGWRRFRHITWPLVLPLLVPLLIIRGIFAFNQFYLFFVVNVPWPLMTFSALSFFLFNPIGQFGGQFAVSAALNLITVVVLVILLLWFNRWSRAAEGVTYA